ncbi:MAG: anthranilate phosphoribosyltransferase, partial [Chloroflexi bacterium]|nr:anthranilate phosphoribosyltransferase [Chloroflexota bacterium]
ATGALASKLAMTLARLGVERALVVHGHGGLDELALSGPSQVYEVSEGEINSYEVGPDRFDLAEAGAGAIRGGSLEKNLNLALQALSGEPSAARDIVILNAGAGLYAAGITDTIRDGLELARETVVSGRAEQKLGDIRAVSQQLRAPVGVSA